MRNGQAVETSTIGCESAPSILSVLTGAPSLNQVFTQVAGSAIRVAASEIRKRAEASTEFVMALLKAAQMDTYQAEVSVACNALHQVQARLARWLLMTQDRVGGSAVPLTQDFLAIMLGVQRTTVSTAASALKRLKLIDYRRGQIDVIDRAGLIKVACECYEDDLRMVKAADRQTLTAAEAVERRRTVVPPPPETRSAPPSPLRTRPSRIGIGRGVEMRLPDRLPSLHLPARP